MIASRPKVVLFYRDFVRFSGGHLKVWHYFNHVRDSKEFTAKVHFSERSRWDSSNPWWDDKSGIEKAWEPHRVDVLFLGGLDWMAVPSDLRTRPRGPVINFIQGLRHTDPTDPRFAFLEHKAIRICAGQKVAEALCSIPHVNGPILHIPMGLGSVATPTESGQEYDLMIFALKAQELGEAIHRIFVRRALRIRLLTEHVPRNDFLREISRARVVVLLPFLQEGFYLPALEAMAMRRIVVCPDCVANQTYIEHGRNAFRPGYRLEDICDSIRSAIELTPKNARSMRNAAYATATATAHSLTRERDAFLKVLSDLDSYWNG